ncbi:MAG: ABC transporter substrate-binding protein [Burkholderiales bacterium]|nr:ABC transporter substrate-binding protein [Pseudomonadota bacterium]MCC7067757.1 ABC transporter substrate-binding protein [Burkholderiales bacterium]
MSRTLFALSLFTLVSGSALAQGTPIRIGEINSYKAQPAFLEPYRKGWELAQEEVNRAGGINGRPLETVFRDDNANPSDAVRAAEELLTREKVALLSGTFLSNIGLAVGDFARQRRVLFVASEPLSDKITWGNGNAYTFRLRASTYMQTSMLVPEAAKLNKKRWGIVYPNYEYGQSAANSFKKLLIAAQPAGGVEFVEQAPPLGKIDAGAVVQALIDARVDAVFNVTFGTDLQKFVREGNTRGLFKDRPVVSLLSGEPEYLDPLKEETPSGWIVTGYPWQFVDTPEHKAFRDAYLAKYKDHPRLGSVVGYATVKSIAAMLKKANSTDVAKMQAAMKNLAVDSPFGRITWRAQDNQSTMGAFVGRLAQKDGRGIMVDWRYVDGKSVQPTDDEVKRLRRAP